jgi:hypothetical protein
MSFKFGGVKKKKKTIFLFVFVYIKNFAMLLILFCLKVITGTLGSSAQIVCLIPNMGLRLSSLMLA